MKRDFKGIWIPKEIWFLKKITVIEKLFFIEIDSLDNQEGCFASNAYFSEFFGISKGRCTQIIKSLESKKLVSIKHERKGNQISKRVIKVFNKLNTPIKNIKHPYLENDEDNNTLVNNTEREIFAFDFLNKNYTSDLEIFLMQNKSQIKDFKKFVSDYDDTVEIEGLKYNNKILFARLRKYARNWIQNQNKYKKEEDKVIPIYRKKIS